MPLFQFSTSMIDSSWLSRSFSLAYTEWHDAPVQDATLRIKSYLWSARKAEKREIHVNYLPDDLKWSVFNLQEWNRAHRIGPFVNLCQPLSTLHLPLHRNLHHGFKLGLCLGCQFIKQKQGLISIICYLFRCQFETTMDIWHSGNVAPTT